MRLHFLLLTACAITSADVSTTGGSTKIEEHSTIHVSHPVVSACQPNIFILSEPTRCDKSWFRSSGLCCPPNIFILTQPTRREQPWCRSSGLCRPPNISTSQNLQDVSSHGADQWSLVSNEHLILTQPTRRVSSHGVGPGSDGFPVGGLLGNLMAHAPQDPKHGSGRDSVSEPIIHYSLLVNNTMHITCFSESGPLPLRYKLFINDKLRQEKVVYSPVAANFTISMTPGTQVYLNCTAISPTGEKSSKNETLRVGDPDDSSTTPEEGETDQKDKDTGLEYLIPLQYILTSVTPDVLGRNNLVLIICGPILLVLLVIFIFVSYLRSRKEHHRELETI
ncbi:hypothetical protein GDO81_012725 [Engystomops pustulosus]|uniref:Uncharacterized protein n=1 Tax=Engystomops pustulosus TaxID=76066 RepID=A0AAV7AUB7_ENGPU|nr:hypothetical protein GDO81_012725 [Engystomops pustulosus]